VRLALVALLLVSCGDDDAAGSFPDGALDSLPDALMRWDAPVGDPSGAWQQAPSLFACFGTAGGADFADTVPEVMETPCCYWDRSGLLYYPNGVTGTWTLEGVRGRLVVTVDPPCGESCGPVYYERLPEVDCTF
jgi:hypothetical protein